MEPVTTQRDNVTSNLVVNPFSRGKENWESGCGTVPSSAITLLGGSAEIENNLLKNTKLDINWGIFAEGSRVPLQQIKIENNTIQGSILKNTNYTAITK